MEETGMVALNSGIRTWTSRKEGQREMAPDITFVHGEEMDKFQWKVLNKLGGSDHHPILITREVDGMARAEERPNMKWDIQNANWDEFARTVDLEIPKDYERRSIHKLEKKLRAAITNAGIQHIGRKYTSRKDNRPGYSKTVKEAIKERK